MERIIMHIDVNNAFLSWSAIDLINNGSKYDIRNSYAVIGGDENQRHGIVLAKSFPCKKLGIVTAETLYSAKRKCPALRVYPPNFSFYSKMSNAMFDLLKSYTPDIEVASIDECYLDYGKVKSLYGDEMEFAKKIQKQIYDELGFTVNIGIANNKLCAKMASDFSKPYKIHTLYDYEVESKMYPLPIDDLFGIGKKTAPKLKQLGILTIGDLANYDELVLSKHFKNMAINMINSAKGINNDLVISDAWIPKGIGNELTLITDTIDKDILYEKLLLISENVGIRLRKQEKYANTICVTIKTKDFKRKSHQKKLTTATNVTDEIFNVSKKILDEMFDSDEPIRLIGIRLDNLTDYKIEQVSIFDDININKKSDDTIDKVVDNIKSKYGYKAIKKASLVGKNEFKKNN